MAKQLQIRGGTTEQHNTFTGASREITIDTSKNTVVVHDGYTPGGFPLAKENSPSFIGNPTAPTQVINNNSSSIATTAYADRAALPINSLRADRYLALQDIANMVYTSGDLTKIQYNNATDVDYEVFVYDSGNLTSIQHYVGSVLKGTTTLSYTSGNLVSAIFVGV